MKQIIYILTLLLLANCGQQKSERTTTLPVTDTSAKNNNGTDELNLTGEQKKNPNDFLPKGFMVFEKINGDLNNDGIEDCVLIIKGTDKKQIIIDECTLSKRE